MGDEVPCEMLCFLIPIDASPADSMLRSTGRGQSKLQMNLGGFHSLLFCFVLLFICYRPFLVVRASNPSVLHVAVWNSPEEPRSTYRQEHYLADDSQQMNAWIHSSSNARTTVRIYTSNEYILQHHINS